MSNGLWRTRWAAVGAAVAVTLGAGGLFTASAAVSSGERTVYVPITPCRIMDTRPGEENRGPRATPIGADETHTIQVRGTNGDCTIPTDAVGVVLNVTSLNSTSGSFLTVFPADAAKPRASSLNWTQGQAPTPNAVTSKLAADGRLSFYNLAGTVDVITDVVGYYADHNHDDRYYTEPEVDAALAGKAPVVHTHDDRYFTEAEVTAALAGKANSISGTTSTLVLGPASFAHDGTIDTAQLPLINTVQGHLEAGGPACFIAPVLLPVGATITSFAMSALDDNGLTLGVRGTLRRDPVGPDAPTQMAQLVTADSATAQSLSTNVITDGVIAAGASYGVDVCLDLDLLAYSVTIGYTNP